MQPETITRHSLPPQMLLYVLVTKIIFCPKFKCLAIFIPRLPPILTIQYIPSKLH